MADIFEYDVFLSFASSDEEIVKPIWQELCVNGLRVFWSDTTLKKELGNSWFDVIESSLEKSRHPLLICSQASMASKWVKREYKAFYNHFYQPGIRRLIPVLAKGYKVSDLPLFLKELEAGQMDDPGFLQEIIPILGGVNIESLRKENQLLKEKLKSLQRENLLLKQDVEKLNKKLKEKREVSETVKQKKNNEVFKGGN